MLRSRDVIVVKRQWMERVGVESSEIIGGSLALMVLLYGASRD